MSEYLIHDTTLSAIADAIRAKTGGTDKLTPDQMATEISNIQTGGGGDNSSFKDIIERTAVNPTLPSDLTKIMEYTFYEYTNLALTSLPAGVTIIGNSAFYKCTNLALTSLPAGLTSIGDSAFYECTNLALTSLPAGLTSIGNSAFQSCPNLALTELPSGLKGTLNGTFFGVKKLNIKTVPTGITIITNSALKDTSITEFTVPANTMLSGYRPLGDNSLLTTVTFEGKPTSITKTAFVGCTNLTTINVPWAEGTVENAPWGATNATINYNYTGE